MPLSISLWKVGAHQVSSHGCHDNVGHHIILKLVRELIVPCILIVCLPLPPGGKTCEKVVVKNAAASADPVPQLTELYCPLDKIAASDFDMAGFSATQRILIAACKDAVRGEV